MIFLKTQINVIVAIVNHYHSNYCSCNLKLRLIRKKQVNIRNCSKCSLKVFIGVVSFSCIL